MTTIAMTKRYSELSNRHRSMVHLYETLSELRLHTNKSVDVELASGYLNNAVNVYPRFFVPALESMRKYFYISLNSFIGGYYDPSVDRIKRRGSDKSSLYHYLYDETRADRKKHAKNEFESLLKDQADNLKLLHELRQSLAHYEDIKRTNTKMIFSDSDAIDILNRLGVVMYLLGFQRWNKPFEFNYENDSANEVMAVIDDIYKAPKTEIEKKRQKYIKKRAEWIKK